MEIYHIVLCCVFFTTVACLSSVDDNQGYGNGSLVLNKRDRRCKCEHGRCYKDRDGNMKCACKPGFSLQSDFSCKPCDCGAFGKCLFMLMPTDTSELHFLKKCVCDLGHAEKDGECIDCSCGENSACDFDFGERNCYCIDGFSENNNVCTRCDCGFNGHCKFQNGSKVCDCDYGYLELNGICEKCNCGHHGSCSFLNGQKECSCNPGFDDKYGRCEECYCGSHGICSFQNGEKICSCRPGYNINNGICEQCNCGFYGTCSFQNGQKICNCQTGFSDKNGRCEKCDCGDYGTCFFLNRQKTCNCQPGFIVNNGRCETCSCGVNSEYCAFIDGVKQCTCKPGYADRYGTCEECYCGSYSKNCTFIDNQKTCSCLEGYVQKGETCQFGCSPQNPCQNGGYCKEGFCFCQMGTRGEFCEVIDECSHLCPNTNDVQCSYDITSQRAYCRCLNRSLTYNPNTKQCNIGCSAQNACQNGGYCKEGFCTCQKGTRGHFCEVIEECPQLCPNTSDIACYYDITLKRANCKCLNSNLKYNPNTRQCSNSNVCQTDNQCVNGVCRNGACQCMPGTWGKRCEIIDCVRGAILCHNQMAILWKGTDTLFVHWRQTNVLMKFVRENVVLPFVTDCGAGGPLLCNYPTGILWCHSGHTVYVPSLTRQFLRYRRVDSTGARCGNILNPMIPPFHRIGKKSEFENIDHSYYVKQVNE